MEALGGGAVSYERGTPVGAVRRGRVRGGARGGGLLRRTSHAPLEDHPLDTHREPSALYCWILEILYCDPKGRRALLRIPSTVGRSVCLSWAKSKPRGPKGRAPKSGLDCLSSAMLASYRRPCSDSQGQILSVHGRRYPLSGQAVTFDPQEVLGRS